MIDDSCSVPELLERGRKCYIDRTGGQVDQKIVVGFLPRTSGNFHLRRQLRPESLHSAPFRDPAGRGTPKIRLRCRRPDRGLRPGRSGAESAPGFRRRNPGRRQRGPRRLPRDSIRSAVPPGIRSPYRLRPGSAESEWLGDRRRRYLRSRRRRVRVGPTAGVAAFEAEVMFVHAGGEVGHDDCAAVFGEGSQSLSHSGFKHEEHGQDQKPVVFEIAFAGDDVDGNVQFSQKAR